MSDKDKKQQYTPACPLPFTRYDTITLAHGSGGRLMNNLINKMFVAKINNPLLDKMHDGAVFPTGPGKMAFTTDSFVVTPLFFPGGDIGKLAVCGTTNDLAMCGAMPRYLSLSFIIEEGFPLTTLNDIVDSIAHTAASVPVAIVTGDTKVVEKKKGDGLYINTSGVGEVISSLLPGPESIQPGDLVLISGDIGRHGLSVLCRRQGLEMDIPVKSDCRTLAPTVKQLLQAGLNITCMRDTTRGGVASALNEIAAGCGYDIEIKQQLLPVTDGVKGACEILGLDPVYAANEGNFLIFIKKEDTDQALTILKKNKESKDAALIGKVTSSPNGNVYIENAYGLKNLLDMPAGEQLPRIC